MIPYLESPVSETPAYVWVVGALFILFCLCVAVFA